MLKEKLELLKQGFQGQEGDGKKKKKIENLVVLFLLLIITIVAINYIWKGDSKEKTAKNEITGNKKLATNLSENVIENGEYNATTQMEESLEKILSQIQGVGSTKVFVTYSQTSQVIPIYDEDSSKSDTEESDKQGGNRKVTESSNKKSIVYQEVNGEKIPITQSVMQPVIEGAIVTAQGASDPNIKTNIIQAVEAVTGLPTHKIQVFEMKKD